MASMSGISRCLTWRGGLSQVIIFKISRYPMFASFIMHHFLKIGGEVCPEQARKESAIRQSSQIWLSLNVYGYYILDGLFGGILDRICGIWIRFHLRKSELDLHNYILILYLKVMHHIHDRLLRHPRWSWIQLWRPSYSTTKHLTSLCVV